MVCDLAKCLAKAMTLLRLNPYSTGIWSATPCKMAKKMLCTCLNPYSTGIWSATKNKNYIDFKISSGLNPYSTGIWSATVNTLPSWLC